MSPSFAAPNRICMKGGTIPSRSTTELVIQPRMCHFTGRTSTHRYGSQYRAFNGESRILP